MYFGLFNLLKLLVVICILIYLIVFVFIDGVWFWLSVGINY